MTTPASTIRALTCSSCGGTIALRAAGNTVSIACEHCGTILDATTPDLAPIAQAASAMWRPPIALGTRGEVRGTTWEIVGYLERTDGYVAWSEYLLFNPYEGYAFLIDDGRRFSLGTLLNRLPTHTGGSITVDGDGYERFGSTYNGWVTFVVGEVYWRVSVQEHVRITDFVRPGVMLSCEESDDERTWTRSLLLDFGEAEGAFGLERRSPSFGGTPAPHEPSPYGERMKEALIIGAVAILTMIAILLMASGSSPVGGAELAIPLDGSTVTQVAGPIDLPDRKAAVRISARAGQLENGWIDLDYSLVNRATQESFDAYALAQYYRGQDSDGPWQEGDYTPEIKLSSIPRGQYDLVIEATGHRWVANAGTTSISAVPDTGATVPVSIGIARGGIFMGNLLLALLALLCWPAIIVLLHMGFEKRRLAPITEDDE